MATTTMDIPAHGGKLGIQTLLPALDANFAAINAGNPFQVGITAVDGADGTAAVTLQIQDLNGTAIAARAVLRVWNAGTTFTAPDGTGITAFAVGTGVELDQEIDLADYRVLTDANGTAVFTLTAADGTYYTQAESNGLAYSGAVTITGN